MTIAIRSVDDVRQELAEIDELPVVAEATTSSRATGDDWERIAVVALEHGIERVPPSVCRKIGEGDFGIDSIERYDEYLEVVLR